MLKTASLLLCLLAPLALVACGAAPTEAEPTVATPAATAPAAAAPAAAVSTPGEGPESPNALPPPPLCTSENGRCMPLSDCHILKGDPSAGQLDCRSLTICCRF